MTESIKENWRQRWLSSLNELTSYDLQKKTWLDVNISNPHWSFVEFISSYFDDLLMNNSYQYFLDNGFITKKEYEIIKDWHESLDKYEEPMQDAYDHLSILNDSKWVELVNTGEKVKDALAQVLNDDERRILTEENTLPNTQ